MFAMKLTQENISKLTERCSDWSAEDFKNTIAVEAVDGLDERNYVIPEFESVHQPEFRGTVILPEGYLAYEFTYTMSDTDWFEITRRP